MTSFDGTVRQTVRLDRVELIEKAAQRAFDPRKLRSMAGERFEPRAVGMLLLSARSDGRYHILDGQHRWRVLQARGYKEWDADVFSDLTPTEEWEIFSLRNHNRDNLSKLVSHTSWSVSGHDGATWPEAIMAKEIDDAAAAQGFFVPEFSDRNPDALVAIDALQTVWKMGGTHLLDRVLWTIRAAWKDDEDRLRRGRSANILRGIAHLWGYHEKHNGFDPEHLVMVLSEDGPFKIESFAADIHERHPKIPMQRAVYQALVKRYNRGRGAGQQLRSQNRSLLRSLRGENNRFAAVSDEVAEDIAQLLLNGTAAEEICAKHQVSPSTITRIKQSKRYTETMDQARFGKVVEKVTAKKTEAV